MTASYSASLLEAWNPSMSIPSGEVRIKPAPLPCAFEAPSTKSFHIGRSSPERVGSASSIGVNSMTKSAFIVVLGLYLMSNSLSSMAYFISLPETSGLCKTYFIGYSVGTSMV